MSKVLAEKILQNGQSLQITQGDISLEEVDAIVNAANERLQHGGGVAWAILHRGGDVIQTESDAWIREHGSVTHSLPAWTSGGHLHTRYVIHAVGPIWGNDDEDKKLSDAVTGSLLLAEELKCESIAFPAISTGIFGFPKERAAEIMLKTFKEYFKKETSNLKIVRLVLFDSSTVDAFLKVWRMENG